MAGTDARFNAADFRTNIRFAMTMGLPNTTAERATFQWDTAKTFTKDDTGGNPFDWTASPVTTVTYPDVLIPVAVEIGGESDDNTNVGTFDISRAVITVLDEDFELLTVNDVFCNRVLLGDNAYEIKFVAPPLGLFDVTVYQIHCLALDES